MPYFMGLKIKINIKDPSLICCINRLMEFSEKAKYRY